MLTNISKMFLILVMLTVVSCIEPYKPEFDAYKPAVVIEGHITDQEGPYTVKVSESADIYYPRFKGISEARVTISDDIGNVAELHETDEGVYLTNKDDIQGQAGRSYQLRVELSDGSVYESEYCFLPESAPVDSVYGIKETETDITDGAEIPGYRFYTDLSAQTDSAAYFAWRAVETYEYTSAYPIDYIYEGELEPFPTPLLYNRCWKTESTHKTSIFKITEQHNGAHVTVPLHHAHLSKFTIKYSLLLRQYVIDKTTYEYFKQLNRLNESQGTFYDIQPFRIQGNIRNIEKPDEYVAGSFFAAGTSDKRIFLSDNSYSYTECQPDYRGAAMVGMFPISAWPIYLTVSTGRLATAPRGCFDCRVKGGVLTQPDFWE